ncbi:hypothetical protein [Chitinophaga sp. CF418]|uniref:hypothetical protein n=1 Tax=Chitinophaga sp. CF418 TaxID=1855287 RepID=UPI0009130A48|nr:hypothetical protein [Chitinophaga sp. CF418]SHN25012.1 hypothetical protein SAMN05216311_107302 [Chitinophaga sp. CF418]
MQVAFVTVTSVDLGDQLDVIYDVDEDFENFFADKTYGDDLKYLLIRLECNSPKFAEMKKPRKPKYRREGAVEIMHGTQQQTDARSLNYEIILDFSRYDKVEREIVVKNLAQDILNSLDVIKTVKQIKDFQLDKFRDDLARFFQEIKWM